MIVKNQDASKIGVQARMMTPMTILKRGDWRADCEHWAYNGAKLAKDEELREDHRVIFGIAAVSLVGRRKARGHDIRIRVI